MSPKNVSYLLPVTDLPRNKQEFLYDIIKGNEIQKSKLADYS